MLATLAKVFWEQFLGFSFQKVVLVGRYAIPKFRFSLMKEIDGR